MDLKKNNINQRRSMRRQNLSPMYNGTDLQLLLKKKYISRKSPSTATEISNDQEINDKLIKSYSDFPCLEDPIAVKVNKIDSMPTCPGVILQTIYCDEKQRPIINVHTNCQVEGCSFETITGLCGQHAIEASKMEKLIFKICQEIRQMDNISNVMNFIHVIILLHFQFYFNHYLKQKYKCSTRYSQDIMENLLNCRCIIWDHVITNIKDNHFTITIPFNMNSMCVNDEEYNAGIVCNITWDFNYESNEIYYDNKHYIYSKEENNFSNDVPGLWFNCVYNSVLNVQKY